MRAPSGPPCPAAAVHRATEHTERSTYPQVQLKLSIQRLRTLQEKKLALAKKSRRDIADLLLKNRVETARLRVEGLIQDDIYVELLELLEVCLLIVVTTTRKGAGAGALGFCPVEAQRNLHTSPVMSGPRADGSCMSNSCLRASTSSTLRRTSPTSRDGLQR